MKAQSGFTLVELLIALAISMMVIFIGSLAYRTYSVYWEKELGRFNQEFALLKGVSNVHSIIRNIKPIVFKASGSGGYVYFEGGDSIIRSITSEAITHDNPAAFEMRVVTGNGGRSSLEYREYSISTRPIITEDDIGMYSDAVVLLAGLEDIRFEYYGWASYGDFAASEEQGSGGMFNKREWFGLYSSKDTLISPELVKIKMKKNGKWSELLIPLPHFLHKDLLQFVGADL